MTKDTTTFVSPEFGIRFENYLNIYHGMGDKVDPAKISHFIDLTPEQSSDYESFVKEVEALASAAAAQAASAAQAVRAAAAALLGRVRLELAREAAKERRRRRTQRAAGRIRNRSQGRQH